MAPFRPYRDRPDRSMSYFQVPVDVIEDEEQLTGWARAAVRAAFDSPAKSARKPSQPTVRARTVVAGRRRGKR